jgi:sporulation protein YlmC with PRC-barrel domain
MKLSVKNITGNSIETTDGMEGKIRDFLFDEDNWVIRYIDADFGSFFKDKRVLLPIGVITEHVWDSKLFLLNITRENIDNSPKPDDIPTVSREYEKKVMKHYGYAAYWDSGYIPPSHPGLYYPARPLKIPAKRIREEDLDTKLRSFKEVKGYHILATDGKLGHVEDVIVDDHDWQMVYLIIDTSNWRPWSKKVILLVNWLENISYASREVSVNVDADIIKNAPEFDVNKPVEEAFERALLDYYKRRFPG